MRRVGACVFAMWSTPSSDVTLRPLFVTLMAASSVAYTMSHVSYTKHSSMHLANRADHATLKSFCAPSDSYTWQAPLHLLASCPGPMRHADACDAAMWSTFGLVAASAAGSHRAQHQTSQHVHVSHRAKHAMLRSLLTKLCALSDCYAFLIS